MQIRNEKYISGAVSRLTMDMVEEFCSHMRDRGRTEETVNLYRNRLCMFYGFLPEDKQLSRASLDNWRSYLKDKYPGFSTANIIVSITNGLLTYLGRRDLLIERFVAATPADSMELSRREYLSLLKEAKRQGRERLYLLIKVFATVGIRVGELEYLTVDSVKAGRTVSFSEGLKTQMPIPRCLRDELMDYCARSGIACGPVFVTKAGTMLAESNIHKEIKNLCEDIGIARDKGSPKNLRRLYLSAYEEINREVERITRLNYEKLIETEQSIYGWELRHNVF